MIQNLSVIYIDFINTCNSNLSLSYLIKFTIWFQKIYQNKLLKISEQTNKTEQCVSYYYYVINFDDSWYICFKVLIFKFHYTETADQS